MLDHPAAERPRSLVLAVDDDADILLLVSSLLAGRGYEIITAQSGREALAIARERKPHVVLLDYMMPDMNGYEVMREMRRADPLCQIVIVTGRGDENMAAVLLKGGAVDYLPKPFENRRLLEALDGALARRLEVMAREAETREKARLEERLQSESMALRESVRARTVELEAANQELLSVNEVLRGKNAALDLLERTYREVFDLAGDGIIKVDPEGRIVMANRMAGDILDDPEAGGKMVLDFLDQPSRERMRELFAGLLSGRVTLEELEVCLPSADGGRAVSLRAVPLCREGKVEELEIVMTDVSRKLAQEKAVRKLRERAIVAGLSRHLSHVLLNALTGAAGYLGRIRKEVGPTGKVERHFDIIAAEMAKMEQVVRGYQDYVDIMNLNPVSLKALDHLMEDLWPRLRDSVKGESARILRPVKDCYTLENMELSAGSAAVYVDDRYFEMGLAYLIRGAVHLTRKAGRRKAELTLATEAAGRTAAVILTTLGVVTPAEVVTGMFSPWEHQMLTQTFDDWGISIANGVAERHNGELEMLTVPEGTRYVLRLPSVPLRPEGPEGMMEP